MQDTKLLLLLCLLGLAAACTYHDDCESCTASPYCGWDRRTDQADSWHCVHGSEYTPTGSLARVPHLYFSDRCPSKELKPVIEGRRATRKYTTTPIDHDTIHKLLVEAQWAPSACDHQDQRYFIMTNPVHRQMVSRFTKLKMNDTRPGDVIFYDAPVVIFIYLTSGPGSCYWFPGVDAGLAAESLMLTAHNMGLATCPIGYSKAGDPIIRQIFNIPKDLRYGISIALGHPAEHPTAHAHRKPPVVHYDS
eukprot:gnl/Trimastix_PCT/3590.p1 GENE.gnl/Trimastix_PCT/3590~~gnl/Trimastix_PCT/3590.p1  ORF type:complete len:249 (-),score=45.87 gnl/Trimastix_PCT/3590:37-783(-)